MTASPRRWSAGLALWHIVALSSALVVCTVVAKSRESAVLASELAEPEAPRIVFVSDRSGTQKIYTANSDGTNVTEVADGDSPAWSWDGEKIAYSYQYSIITMNRDGTGKTVVAEGWSPAWSPDGTKLVYVTSPWGPDLTYSPSSGGIYFVNADGTGATRLLSHEFCSISGWDDSICSNPVWSPDGTKIAFVSYDYEYPFHVCTMNADGSNAKLLSWGSWKDHPAWSPGGNRIAFATGPGNRIASLKPDGSELTTYFYTGGYVDDIDWSPDGSQLIYARGGIRSRWAEPPEPYRIWVGGNGSQYQLIPEATDPAKPDYDDTQPAWSRTP